MINVLGNVSSALVLSYVIIKIANWVSDVCDTMKDISILQSDIESIENRLSHHTGDISCHKLSKNRAH